MDFMNAKTKLLSVGLILLLIIVSLTTYVWVIQREKLLQIKPVAIYSDVELQNFTQNYGFDGKGTKSDPYVIDNLLINDGTTVSFTLHNTESYVIIENSVMHNATRQNIWLWNVKHVTIRNNQFYNGTGDAIYVNFSSDVIIDNNEIFDIGGISNGYYNGLLNFAVSIDIQYSTRISITNNHIHDTYDGIWLWGYDSFSVINDNRIENLVMHGIGFGAPGTHDIQIRNNYITGVVFGMWLLGPEGDSIIDGNTIINAYDGINAFTNNLTITNNYFEQIDQIGIIMQNTPAYERSVNNTISHNTFTDIHAQAIRFEDSAFGNNQVSDNNFIRVSLDHDNVSYILDNGRNNTISANYYDNFTGSDMNADGFFDSSYKIDGSAQNADQKPRVEPLPYSTKA